MTAVSFENIKKAYGDVEALRDVSFDVSTGEVFGLLGPNGAGKTTLIRILMDIIRANSGRMTLFGEPRRREHTDRIGYLPEDRGLYIKHKVIDVLTYFGALKGLSRKESRSRSLQWLGKVGLPETARWKVSQLSKGMSQKVQIAGTLLSEPDLCLLDEPFAGLDPVNVRLVHDLITQRKADGLTTILSTHQMNLVETLCDRVVLIDRGLVKEYGTVTEVRQRHSKPEVRVVLSSSLPPIPGVTTSVQENGRSWLLHLAADATPQQVLAALVNAGAGVEHFEKILTPMEEVFISVVQGGGR
jgi:ABC-2 type transport system ATP-binding protein